MHLHGICQEPCNSTFANIISTRKQIIQGFAEQAECPLDFLRIQAGKQNSQHFDGNGTDINVTESCIERPLELPKHRSPSQLVVRGNSRPQAGMQYLYMLEAEGLAATLVIFGHNP